MSWADSLEIDVTAICNVCNWKKDIIASRFNDPDLTECFVFKTCPKCLKCQQLLEFQSPKFNDFQKVHPIHPKDVDFIMKSYLKLYSTLAKTLPPYNFEKKCAVGTKILKGIPLEPSELSYLYGVRQPFEFHSDLDCSECKKVHNLRAVYLEENTGNTVKMFMDNTSIVEKLLSFLSERELPIIPNGECIICLDTMNDTCKRCDKCEKQYHRECIQKWMKKSKSCPHCRQSLENTVFIFFALNGRFYSFFEGHYKNRTSISDGEYYSIGYEDGDDENSDDEEEWMIEEEGWITDDEEQYRENFLEEGADEMERRAEENRNREEEEDMEEYEVMFE